MKNYLSVACYIFTPIDDPQREIEEQKSFLENRDVSGRIYISEKGVNCQMSGAEDEARAFMEWLKARFPDIRFNIQPCKENIFPRMTVKYRKQLVALDKEVETSEGGEYLSPKEWREKLDKGDNFLIDVRNDYEWKIGHFKGADLPALSEFRDFPEYAENLKTKIDPQKTEVLMYCTGGIRCELYSSLMKKLGFEKVYQLEGGIINYGNKEGNSHFLGKLFVFDDRLAVPISSDPVQAISECDHCKLPSDTYYNCANMECNDLFLSCPNCHEIYLGACSFDCKNSPQRRPYKEGNKPFRRKHLL